MTVLKCKIRYKRVIIFLLVLLLLVLMVIKFFNMRITNIYVEGNVYLSDQDIIELAHLENYPRVVTIFPKSLESKISSSKLVESVIVKKKFSRIFISVVENRPLFYDEKNKRTVLKNGDYVDDLYNVPLLSSTVGSDIYSKFLNKLSLINLTAFDSISEISYTPNSVDNEFSSTWKSKRVISTC